MIPRGILLCILLPVLVTTSAQSPPTTYLIRFNNKSGTPFAPDAPEAFLSPRAIDRRAVQGISVDSTDLPVDPVYITTVLAQGDVQLVNRSKWFNAITVRTSDTVALAAIGELPFVTQVVLTRRLHGPAPDAGKFTRPMDARGGRGGGDADYGPSFNQLALMNGQVLHELDARGQGMLIGVLDSGFDGVDSLPAFAELRDRGGITLTRDMVEHDGDVYADHWHGRSVLSCMAGIIQGQLIGSAPDADYVLLRSEDAGTENLVEEDNWIAAAELADSIGCDVINTSLGYTVFDDSLLNHAYADMNGTTTRISIAAGMAAQKGMIPVCSAGNSGETAWYHIGAPADAIDILAVGAVNSDGQSAAFSSRGPSADGRVKPDVCAVGEGAIGLRLEGDSIAAINGTSFAAPILAGMVACLWQLHPDRSAHDIMFAVRSSAHLWSDPNDSLGYGIPDFQQAHDHLTLTSGIPGTPDHHGIIAYPLPFVDHLTVMVPEGDGNRAALHDPMGRIVWSAPVSGTGPVTLSDAALRTLAPGAYILRVRGHSSMVVKGD